MREKFVNDKIIEKWGNHHTFNFSAITHDIRNADCVKTFIKSCRMNWVVWLKRMFALRQWQWYQRTTEALITDSFKLNQSLKCRAEVYSQLMLTLISQFESLWWFQWCSFHVFQTLIDRILNMSQIMTMLWNNVFFWLWDVKFMSVLAVRYFHQCECDLKILALLKHQSSAEVHISEVIT